MRPQLAFLTCVLATGALALPFPLSSSIGPLQEREIISNSNPTTEISKRMAPK